VWQAAGACANITLSRHQVLVITLLPLLLLMFMWYMLYWPTEPAVRLTVTIIQRLAIHCSTSDMRLSILHDIADTSIQLLLAAGRQLDSSRSSSSSSAGSSSIAVAAVSQLAAAGLQDSSEFLALMLLVLHGQLTASGYFPASTNHLQEVVEEQAEQLLFKNLLEHELKSHRYQLHAFTCFWASDAITLYWEAAPCWQQHSSAADIRLVAAGAAAAARSLGRQQHV
jgi:hypothetical protein